MGVALGEVACADISVDVTLGDISLVVAEVTMEH